MVEEKRLRGTQGVKLSDGGNRSGSTRNHTRNRREGGFKPGGIKDGRGKKTGLVGSMPMLSAMGGLGGLMLKEKGGGVGHA